MRYEHSFSRELEGILLNLSKNRKLLQEFLKDLLSPAEYKDLSVRWQIVKQLKTGLTQREVARNLKVSISTVTRGARELQAKNGGFNKIYDKYYKKNRTL